jgi:hypothetical protein
MRERSSAKLVVLEIIMFPLPLLPVSVTTAHNAPDIPPIPSRAQKTACRCRAAASNGATANCPAPFLQHPPIFFAVPRRWLDLMRP